MKIHDAKINHISHNGKANLFATCSFDGYVKLFNLYSRIFLKYFRLISKSLLKSRLTSNSFLLN